MIFLLVLSSFANEVFDHQSRVQKISNTIEAIFSTPKQQLNNTKELIQQETYRICRSSLLSLKLPCYIDQGKKFCNSFTESEYENCLLYMDLFTINFLSQKSFISKREKYKIIKKYKNFKKVFNEKLLSRYGELSTIYALNKHFKCGLDKLDCFSKGLDHFCREYSDKGKLTWQSCVGAVIEFTTSD